jgi:hypothetical protein
MVRVVVVRVVVVRVALFDRIEELLLQVQVQAVGMSLRYR